MKKKIIPSKKTELNNIFHNKKGMLDDLFDLLVTVMLALFAFIFIHIVFVQNIAGEAEGNQVKTTEHVQSVVYAARQEIHPRNPLDVRFPTSFNNDPALTSVDTLRNRLSSGEASILHRNVPVIRTPLSYQEYLPLEARKLFSLDWENTEHIEKVIAESQRQGVDPCYGVITILHESKGEQNAVGNDANVVGCVVQARRILLMQESAHCKSLYADETALKEDCLENKLIPRAGKWDRPKPNANTCLDDFINLREYSSPKPNQEEFCERKGNFKPYLRYGIGLGQLTPEANAYEMKIAGKIYTYCGLFDPEKNSEALVAQLKVKGASSASTPEEIQHVFGKYIGVATLAQGVDRYNDFVICKEVMANKEKVS